MPTDTLYGISANALDARVAPRVFRVKGREEFSPLPIFVSDPDDLFQFGRDVPDVAARLAEIFWPGKLTIVVKKGADIRQWFPAASTPSAFVFRITPFHER